MHHGHFDYFLNMGPMDWCGVIDCLVSCLLFLAMVIVAAVTVALIRSIYRGEL